MAKILHLVWFDHDHKKNELKIVNEASNMWREMGTLLGFSPATLEAVEQRTYDNSKRFQLVVEKWLETGGSTYPATWRGLQQVFVDCEMARLAENIKVALSFVKDL